MNRAEPLSLVEKIMAQHSGPSEPDGKHTFCEDLTDIGWRDCTFEVEWTFRNGRVCIDGIEVVEPLELDKVMIDPIFGSSLHKALYPRLASIALGKSEDILEAYYDSL